MLTVFRININNISHIIFCQCRNFVRNILAKTKHIADIKAEFYKLKKEL